MGFGFSPTLWFACKLCRKTFPDTNQLLVHKTESHLRDCLNIKCVLFEEKLLDHELTPSDLDLYPQNKCQEEQHNSRNSNTTQDQEAQSQRSTLRLPENKRKLPTETSASSAAHNNHNDKFSKKQVRCQNPNSSVWLDSLHKQEQNTNPVIPPTPTSLKDSSCDPNPTNMTANDVSSTLNWNRKTKLKPNFEYVVKIEETAVHATLQPKQNSDKFLEQKRPQDFLTVFDNSNNTCTTTHINKSAEIGMTHQIQDDFEEEEEELQVEERDPFGDLNVDPPEPEPLEPENELLDQEFPCPVILSSCTVAKNNKKDCEEQYSIPEVIDLESDDDDAFEPKTVVVVATNNIANSNRPFPCPMCPSRFRSKANLNSHKRIHSERRPFPCPNCPVAFKRNASLRYHLITHGHPTDYSCRYCGKSFRSEKSVADHERATHTGDRPFKCELEGCGSFFASTSALTMHTRVKHCAELGLEQFPCPVCGRTFGLKSYLTRHLPLHQSSKKQFKCFNPNCTNSYKFKWQLTEHLKTCNKCNSHF